MKKQFSLSLTGATAESLDRYEKHYCLTTPEAVREILITTLAGLELPIAKVKESEPTFEFSPAKMLMDLNGLSIVHHTALHWQPVLFQAARQMEDSPNFKTLSEDHQQFVGKLLMKDTIHFSSEKMLNLFRVCYSKVFFPKPESVKTA